MQINKHTISPIIWKRGTYFCEIDGKVHSARRRRTLRRLAQRKTGTMPTPFRQLA